MDLYLDDIRRAPDGWTVCRSVTEAKALLEAGQVDGLSLDHDMGECAACEAERGYLDATTNCRHVESGYDLVKWMVETGHWPKRKPLIHSANPVGRANMRATIERYWPEK